MDLFDQTRLNLFDCPEQFFTKMCFQFKNMPTTESREHQRGGARMDYRAHLTGEIQHAQMPNIHKRLHKTKTKKVAWLKMSCFCATERDATAYDKS